MKTLITISLILLTAALATLSLMQLGRIDVGNTFSASNSSKENLTRLFDDELRTTAHIVINSANTPEHRFSFDTETGFWMGTSPWNDRADGPKAIEKLVLFAINTEIQDSLPATKDNLDALGFSDSDAVEIKFSNIKNNTIAHLAIGKSSSWFKKIEGKQVILVPTIYIRRLGDEADNTIYLCTDASTDIHALFRDKLSAFRDHRPFALNINTLREVKLLRGNTELVLSRPIPTSSWTLTKPLELATDRPAVMKFLANLSKLEATALHETDSISLPTDSETYIEVTISNFGSDQQQHLKVYPPTDNAATCYATVSNRDVIFELPLIAPPNISNYITQLPKSVNELRSRLMLQWTKLHSKKLQTVIVRSPHSPSQPVIVSRIAGAKYQLLTDKEKKPVDELILAKLIQKLATTPVKDFASDATTDFSTFGLNTPTIVVDFLNFDKSVTEIRFGKVSHPAKDDQPATESYYANLRGSPIVWEVDSALVSSIPTRYWLWQPKTVWSLPLIDITEFSAQQKGKEKLTVKYNYLEDTFSATLGSNDVTSDLNPQRAKFYLNENHHITAQKRLPPHDPVAAAALQNPIFTVTFTVQGYDNEGLATQLNQHTIQLAKSAKKGSSAFYYAKSNTIDGFFTLSLESVRKLASIDLLEDDE